MTTARKTLTLIASVLFPKPIGIGHPIGAALVEGSAFVAQRKKRAGSNRQTWRVWRWPPFDAPCGRTIKAMRNGELAFLRPTDHRDARTYGIRRAAAGKLLNPLNSLYIVYRHCTETVIVL